MKFFKQQKNRYAGFTLIETLVALSIFSLAVIGLTTTLSKGVADISYAKQGMAAEYLAQEGLEATRNMRDVFMLYSATSAVGWGQFITLISAGCETADPGCYYDDRNLDATIHSAQMMTDQVLFPCSPICPALLYNSSTGKYGYVTGVNSGFVREINVDLIATDKAKVTSTVTWVQGSGSRTVTFTEFLYRWGE